MFSLWKLCLHYYPVGDDWFPSFPSENQVPPQKIHPIARRPPPPAIYHELLLFFFSVQPGQMNVVYDGRLFMWITDHPRV